MIRLARDPKYAPCGYLIMRAPFDKYDEKNTILIQTDWDFPGVARSFGWDMSTTQKPDSGYACPHHSTDGTVTCGGCGLTASDFISAATDYLDDIANTEHEAEDPGYFSEED